jgi:Bacterial regulatory protein, Fis family
LFNAVQRAVAFSPGKLILPSHLQLGAQLAEADATTFHFQEARSLVIGNFEQHYIEDMLRKHEGNVTRAAREAGKDRRVFGRLMKKYQVARGTARSVPTGPPLGLRGPTWFSANIHMILTRLVPQAALVTGTEESHCYIDRHAMPNLRPGEDRVPEIVFKESYAEL